MSSFAGRAGEPWSLARAVDALAGAARAAGRPGLIWLAGIGYPAVGIGLGMSLTQDWLGGFGGEGEALHSGPELALEHLVASSPGLLLLLLALLRLAVGLARVAPPSIWDRLATTFGRVRLRQSWRAGRGLTRSTAGMALVITVMMLVVVRGIALPLGLLAGGVGWFGTDGGTLALALLVSPAVALMAAYALVLSAIQQLSLQSLAHNRRGVASALGHGWRLARHDPWATGRTLAVDLILNVVVVFVGKGLGALLALAGLGTGGHVLAMLPLLGFAGVTRAGYWARAYRALGGLSPDDGVPGLDEESLPIA